MSHFSHIEIKIFEISLRLVKLLEFRQIFESRTDVNTFLVTNPDNLKQFPLTFQIEIFATSNSFVT